MLDELRHYELEDEVVASALACDTDLAAVDLERCRDTAPPPSVPDRVEDDVDPSIR